MSSGHFGWVSPECPLYDTFIICILIEYQRKSKEIPFVFSFPCMDFLFILYFTLGSPVSKEIVSPSQEARIVPWVSVRYTETLDFSRRFIIALSGWP